jgi:hypothetical protein
VSLLGVGRHDVEACNEGNVAGFGERRRPIRAYICSLYRADFFVMFASDKEKIYVLVCIVPFVSTTQQTQLRSQLNCSTET